MNKQEHPIDKLFASRLQGLEPMPAANTWSRLEKGLQQKKTSKKGVIWWYCAAAVAVLILFGALLMGTDKQLGGINASDIASSLPDSQSASQEGKSLAESNPVEADHNSSVAVTPEKQVESLTETEKSALEKDFSVPSNKVTEAAQAVKSTKRPVVKKEDALVKHEAQPKLPGQEPSEEMITQVDASDSNTITPPVAVPTDSEQTLVVVVQLPEEKEENAAQGKGQRVAGKLWENLKKVKHGEFRELGLAPDELMARFRDKRESEKD